MSVDNIEYGHLPSEAIGRIEIPDDIENYDLIITKRQLENSDWRLSAAYVPKSQDQINLGCDGC